MLFALLLTGSLSGQIPSQTVDPRTESAVIVSVLADYSDQAIVPRSFDRPLLSGTEGITLQSHRDRLSTVGPYQRFETAQDVLEHARDYGNTLGAAAEMAEQAIGWSVLMQNYVNAILLGELRKGHNYRSEALKVLLTTPDSEGGPVSLRNWFATLSSQEAKSTSLFFCTLLRKYSTLAAFEASYLTNSLDPEGYLRQQLRLVSYQLNRVADTISDATQAVTY